MLLSIVIYSQATYIRIEKKSGGVDSIKLADISQMYFINSVSDTTIPAGFIKVQGGSFTMGSPDGFSDELPLHMVTLSSYCISKTEVTQGQWKAVMGTNPSAFTSVGDNAPLEGVNWYSCIGYCNKLSVSEGKTPCYNISGNTNPSDWTSGTIICDFTVKGYRLPTEAEWEYASRGGSYSLGYIYSGSDTVYNVAWYNDNSGSTTHVVGAKKANELGLFDMSGNITEWCWDYYGSYSSVSQTNPTGPLSGSFHILRGGSWTNTLMSCRPTLRTNYGYPAFFGNAVGLRLAITN